MTARAIFKNRQVILKALKIDPVERHATYAVEPFRIVEIQGKVWIGGAVGVEGGPCYGDWTPTGDVILWNPRTGAVATHNGPGLIMPIQVGQRLTVYADGFAFFRAWADRRAQYAEARCLAQGRGRNTFAEPKDANIPGALVVGDLSKVQWRETNATVLVAGPGVDARSLNRAVLRSARLPRVESLAA